MLVLSQLDNRYFRGLQGQYNYRLQFRLHEEGKPGAEEYVVRSHGNYLMDRSVSVEVPSVAPGSYVVFIAIVGERDTRLLSTEDVIQRECKSREENEKLAQVGQAYDFAHSKARAHLERLSAVRKKAESKKASESRRKERRKNWEKREIGREVNRKQKAKDEEKKAKGRAAKKAKAEREAVAAASAEATKAAEEKKAAEQVQQHQADSQTGQKSDQSEPKKEASAEADNASTTSALSSSSTGTPQPTPQDTPKSEAAQPVEDNSKVHVPVVSVSGGPPPALAPAPALEVKVHSCQTCNNCKPPPPKPEETDYASDSPVEDYERLYDEDDMSPTLRMLGTAAAPSAMAANSDDEDTPDPWNAIAVVGFRVYSKDEELELRVVMEGGALEQDGMGNLGEVDLDNAVSNAAGQRDREQKKEVEKKNDTKVVPAAAEVKVTGPDTGEARPAAVLPDEKASGDGMASYRTIVERKTSEFDRVVGKAKVEDYFNSKAAHTSTPDTPSTTTISEEPENPAIDSIQKPQTHIDLSNLDLSPAEALEKRFKQVLYIRHMLQKNLMRCVAPNVDMQLMSELLAALEAYPDMEADLIRKTKVYKVLLGMLKQRPHVGMEGFWERVEVLADDYQLIMMDAE